MIPFAIFIYCSALFFQYVVLHSGEIFPFFRWSLFSSGHAALMKSYVRVEAVDGIPIEAHEGLISVGDRGIRLRKSVAAVARHCEKSPEVLCKKNAIRLLLPFIHWPVSYSSIRFSATQCFVEYDHYVKKLEESTGRFPKFIDCDSVKMYGPWSVGG